VSPLLHHKVAIITGAGRGIGRATAELFAEEGCAVLVSDIDEAYAQETATAIKASGGTAHALAGDVTDAAFPERLMRTAQEFFGRLDILVNNAGFTWDGTLHKMTDPQWQMIIDTHLTAPFRIIRAAAPLLRSTGIVGLTKTLAREWGPFNIQVNCVAFGFIDTRLTRGKEAGESIRRGSAEIELGIPTALREASLNLIPMGRPGTGREAAGAILFLASPLSDYVSGQVLEVTGGL
jgi:3-oxoacyl-[acyl-carrier protein] reductase